MPSRRERNEGSVFFDKTKELWVARVPIPGQPGKRLSETARSRPEARAALAGLKAKAEAWTPPGALPTAQLLSGYLDFWLESTREAQRPKTRSFYEYHVNTHLKPYFGSVPVLEIDALKIIDGFARAAKAGVTVANRRGAHATLSSALSYAVKVLRVLKYNPARDVPKPASETQEKRPWTPAELKAFLEATEDRWWHNLWFLLAHTGARLGELLGLHWDAVDFAAGTLRIDWTLTEVDGVILGRFPPKSDAARRTVALDPTALRALRRQRAQLFAAGYAAGAAVFPNEDGMYSHQAPALKSFQKATRAEGLPVITLHDLRHTHATILIAAGVSPKDVAARIGHEDVALTMRTYVHSSSEAQRKAADVFATAVGVDGGGSKG